MTGEREEYLADARILALLTGCQNETLLNIVHQPTVFRPRNLKKNILTVIFNQQLII